MSTSKKAIRKARGATMPACEVMNGRVSRIAVAGAE
jgi:hypothetical protein